MEDEKIKFRPLLLSSPSGGDYNQDGKSGDHTGNNDGNDDPDPTGFGF